MSENISLLLWFQVQVFLQIEQELSTETDEFKWVVAVVEEEQSSRPSVFVLCSVVHVAGPHLLVPALTVEIALILWFIPPSS